MLSHDGSPHVRPAHSSACPTAVPAVAIAFDSDPFSLETRARGRRADATVDQHVNVVRAPLAPPRRSPPPVMTKPTGQNDLVRLLSQNLYCVNRVAASCPPRAPNWFVRPPGIDRSSDAHHPDIGAEHDRCRLKSEHLVVAFDVEVGRMCLLKRSRCGRARRARPGGSSPHRHFVRAVHTATGPLRPGSGWALPG